MKTFLSLGLMLLGVLIILINGLIPVRYWILKKREEQQSCIPIIGGILGSIGMVISTNATLKDLSWVPLILDVGCFPMIAYAVFLFFLRKIKK